MQNSGYPHHRGLPEVPVLVRRASSPHLSPSAILASTGLRLTPPSARCPDFVLGYYLGDAYFGLHFADRASALDAARRLTVSWHTFFDGDACPGLPYVPSV